MPLTLNHPAESGLMPVMVANYLPKAWRSRLGMTGAMVERETSQYYENWGVSHLVDFANTVMWPHDHSAVRLPRGAWGSWSQALPIIKTAMTLQTISPTPGVPQTTYNRDYWNALGFGTIDADDDFAPRSDIDSPDYISKRIPSGVVAVAVESTGHENHMTVAVTSGGPIVAQQLGNNPHDYSSYVCEILQDGIDPERRGVMSDTHWVRGWVDEADEARFMSGTAFAPPSGQTYAKPVLAYPKAFAALTNATRSSGRTSGYATWTHADLEASYSYEVSGPFRPATDKHKIWETFDHRNWNAGSLSTDAYINAGDPDHDCPAEHEEPFWESCGDGLFPFWVHKRVDPNYIHPFLGSTRDGLWRRIVYIPIAIKPPCDITKDIVLDGNGNPNRVFFQTRQAWNPTGMQTSGLTFQARPGIMNGYGGNSLIVGKL